MLPLFIEEFESHKGQNICYICRKEFESKSTNLEKVKNHYNFTGKYRNVAYNDCNLIYGMPQEIQIVLYDGSIYNFIWLLKIRHVSLKQIYMFRNKTENSFFCFNGRKCEKIK